MQDAERLAEYTEAFTAEIDKLISDQGLAQLRKREFIDRLACAFWVQWDPLGRQRDPSLTAEARDKLRDDMARACVTEARRMWRIRNEGTEEETHGNETAARPV